MFFSESWRCVVAKKFIRAGEMYPVLEFLDEPRPEPLVNQGWIEISDDEIREYEAARGAFEDVLFRLRARVFGADE